MAFYVYYFLGSYDEFGVKCCFRHLQKHKQQLLIGNNFDVIFDRKNVTLP